MIKHSARRILRRRLKGLVASALTFSHAYDLLFRYQPNTARVLMYHRVKPPLEGDSSGQHPGLPHRHFILQIQYIKTRMTPISLGELTQRIAAGRPLPPRAIAVTFDDGYEDNYTNAYPVLKQYGVPATIFLISGFVGSSTHLWWDRLWDILHAAPEPEFDAAPLLHHLGLDRPISPVFSLRTPTARSAAAARLSALFTTLSNHQVEHGINLLHQHLSVSPRDIAPSQHRPLRWEQIREMSLNGIHFGAHTVHHPNLTTLREPLELSKEILESKRTIEQYLATPVTGFVYPYGLRQHYNSSVMKAVAAAGLTYACTAEPGLVTPRTDLYQIPRISAPDVPLPLFLWNLSKMPIGRALRGPSGQLL